MTTSRWSSNCSGPRIEEGLLHRSRLAGRDRRIPGQWELSTGYVQRGVEAAPRPGKRSSSRISGRHALHAAVFGQCMEAKPAVTRALRIIHNSVSLTRGGLALAWCGEMGDPASFIGELATRYPHHTVVNRIWIPAIRATLDLKRNRAESAIETLNRSPLMKRPRSSGRNTSARTPICSFGENRKLSPSSKRFFPTAVRESTPSYTRWLTSAWLRPPCSIGIPSPPASLTRIS